MAHLDVKRYGDFILTEAVRPAYDLKVVPRQGYRHDTYHDDHTKAWRCQYCGRDPWPHP